MCDGFEWGGVSYEGRGGCSWTGGRVALAAVTLRQPAHWWALQVRAWMQGLIFVYISHVAHLGMCCVFMAACVCCLCAATVYCDCGIARILRLSCENEILVVA
jgi:hypothetical protein